MPWIRNVLTNEVSPFAVFETSSAIMMYMVSLDQTSKELTPNER